jgi:two-component system cell cycle response regulator CtrA
MARVLIVEPDLSTARTIAWVLHEDGHVPHVAATMAEALECASRVEPQLAVVNTGAPVEVKERFFGHLREIVPQLAFIDITTPGAAVDRPATGAAATIVKPFDADSLLGIVRGVLPA